MTVRLHKELQGEVPAPVRLRREARQAAWDASRTGFPARPDPADWPATHLAREPVLGLITRPPFTLPNPGTRNMQVRGAGLALDWLAGFPGGTWQQRWHASGAEDAGAGWKQDCAGWMDARGVHAGNRMDELSIGLILAVCADIVRPGLPWLTASGVSPGALARNLGRTRDQAGLSRLRKAIDDGAVSVGARHAAIRRAAVIMAAKGGTLAEIAAGDFLELLDAERAARSRTRDYSAVSWRLLRRAGAFGGAGTGIAGPAAHDRAAQPRRTRRPLPARLPARPRPDSRLPARTTAGPGLPQPGYPRPAAGPKLLGRPGTTSPRHRQPEPAAGDRRRMETADARPARRHRAGRWSAAGQPPHPDVGPRFLP